MVAGLFGDYVVVSRKSNDTAGCLRGECLKYRQGKVKVFERAREQIIYQEKPYGVGAESIIL